ncbi:MAG: protein TolR [Desulfobacterales bacterium]
MVTGSNGDRLMADINVTPFVDVMLVLLIIFMVTAPMMIQGVDIDLPEAGSQPLTSEDEQLLISIDEQQRVFINDYAVSIDYLRDKIESIMAGGKGQDVYLRADKNVPYGVVVLVMSEIKSAGVDNLGIVTSPDDDAGKKTSNRGHNK